MRRTLAFVAIVTMVGGCSPGYRRFPDLDERLEGMVLISGRAGGLQEQGAPTPYAVFGGGVVTKSRVPSDDFAGAKDEWQGLVVSAEGGVMFQILGDRREKLWVGAGLQALGVRLVKHESGPDGRHDHTVSEAHDVRSRWGGGPVLRLGFGWISEAKPSIHRGCGSSQDQEQNEKWLTGPEIGIGYVVIPDLGSGLFFEFSFFNLRF